MISRQPLVVACALLAISACSSAQIGDRADANVWQPPTPDAAREIDAMWEATPELLIDEQPGVRGMTFDDNYVYWNQIGAAPEFVDGKVLRIPKWGGTAETLCEAQRGIQRVTVDGSHVFFSAYYGQTISRVDKSGGEPMVVASGLHSPVMVKVDDDHVFFTNNGAFEVARADKTGGGYRILASEMIGPLALSLTDTHVYWGSWGPGDEEEGGGRIVRASKDGDDIEELATGLTRPNFIQIVGDDLVWVEDGKGVIHLPAGTDEPVVLAPGSSITSLVAGADRLFFTNSENSTVQTVRLTGGTVTTLATGMVEPRLITTDGASLFWVTLGAINEPDGALWRLSL